MKLKTTSLNYKDGYFISIVLLVASLPLSKFTMSVFQFCILLFWLWHGVSYPESLSRSSKNSVIKIIFAYLAEIFKQLINKFKILFKDKVALVFVSIFFMHIIGLAYTTDFNYAFNDIRIKIPLFILPLFFVSGPKLSLKQLHIIFIVYILAVLGGITYQSLLFYQAGEASAYAINSHVSHIRFSLNAIFAMALCFYFVFSKTFKNVLVRLLFVIPIVIIVAFVLHFNYKTGIMLIPIVVGLSVIFLIINCKNKIVKTTAIIGTAIVIILGIIGIKILFDSFKPKTIDFATLDKVTAKGNAYTHDTINYKTHNGKWMGLYICYPELIEEWNKHSSTDFYDKDKKDQPIRGTLIKYLASKDLRKDAEGFSKLSSEDIENIENGINNANYMSGKTLRNNFEDFYAGYCNYKTNKYVNYNTYWQRVEYWRTSILIIKQHPVFGVGTGDLQLAFDKQYEKMQSTLDTQFRHRSHNQFLAIAIAFGLVGLALFVFVQFYPAINQKSFKNYYFYIFWFIAMISMLTEDTLETQEGVTFYAVFMALFLFAVNFANSRDKSEQET